MCKSQCSCMQCLPGTDLKAIIDKLLIAAVDRALHDPVSTIEIVIEKRMPNMLHVNPDLVGATGFEHAFNQRYIIESLDHFVMCNGILTMIAFGISFKQFAKAKMSSYMRDDGSAVLVHVAPGKGDIFSFHRMIEEL